MEQFEQTTKNIYSWQMNTHEKIINIIIYQGNAH